MGKSGGEYSEHTEVDFGHGRIETRYCAQLVVETQLLSKTYPYRWDGLKTIIKVTTNTEEKASGTKSRETRWYIISFSSDAKQVLNAVRSHWLVESMHWMLDMTFREDESRIRKGHGALAFNILRKIAFNLFREDTTRKASIARKSDNYSTGR